MAATGPVIIKLSDLVDGQEAVCFAARCCAKPAP